MNDVANIMESTFTNLRSIYRDVASIISTIEDGIIRRGFRALGDNTVTWDNSGSTKGSDYWVPRWFCRAYTQGKDVSRQVGFCIHLGGYDGGYLSKLQHTFAKEPPLPLLSVSSMSVPAGAAFDNAIRDCYWDAGWGGTEQTVTRNVATGKCNVRPGADAKYKTYFVDLCRLTSRAEVEKLVLTPMQALFENAFEESFASLRPHLVEYRSTDK